MRFCSTIWATPGFAKEIPAAPFFNTNVLWRLIDNIQRRRQIFIWCVTKPVLWNCRKHEPIGISVLRLPISMYGLLRIAFWIAIFALAVLLLGSRRSGATIAVLVGALLVFGGAAYACYAVDNGPQGRAVAIVTGKNIQARLATADTAGAVLALPAGSEVKILSTRGEWVYAALPNNLNGWIPAASIEPIRIRL